VISATFCFFNIFCFSNKIPTFTAPNDKKVEKIFIHIAEGHPFHWWIAVAGLPFVMAPSRPTRDKEFCLAGNYEKNQKPNAHR
jgi:hypothetical protein